MCIKREKDFQYSSISLFGIFGLLKLNVKVGFPDYLFSALCQTYTYKNNEGLFRISLI